MEPRGLMGGLYKISEWIMRFATINILWIVCSIPFLMFIIPMLMPVEGYTESEVLSQMSMMILPLIILAPFVLFPATAAMFTVARKWVMGEVDVPLFKTFFKGYKENYKQSMLGGLIYVVVLTILIIDIIFFWNHQDFSFLAYIFIAFTVLAFVSLFNFFSMTVHYEMKTLQLVKNAVLITIGRPIRSFSTAVMCGAVMFISIQPNLTFLIPFFMGSVIAFLAFWNFHLIYLKLQEQMEKARIAQSFDEADDVDQVAEIDRIDLVKDEQNNNQK